MHLYDWIKAANAAEEAKHPTRLSINTAGVLVVTGRQVEGRGYANVQSLVPWSRLDCLTDPVSDILRTIQRNCSHIDKELKL